MIELPSARSGIRASCASGAPVVGRESNDGTGQSDRDIHGRPRVCRLHPCERLASPCWISLRPDSLRRPT